MKYKKSLESMSDDELLRGLSALVQKSRRMEFELVAHIGEVNERELYRRETSSMFAYCTEVLHLSEAEAYLRINAARASRRHPMLLDMLRDGRLHLSAIVKLAPHLNEANREAVLARAVHRTKAQIDELIAEIAPKPDVPTVVRKLPERREKIPPSPDLQLHPGGVAPQPAPTPDPTPIPVAPARLQPLSPSRYKVQFTASAELRDKLERLRALMRSSVPDGDIASIIEEAVTEKLERLESKRFGKAKAPRKNLEETDTSASSRRIPAAVKRAVCERDGNQCTFVGENGRRCTHRDGLEFHHKKPFGRGGDHSVDNVQLVCRTHNSYLAEIEYGKDVVERHRRSFSGVCEPELVYTIGSSQLVPDGVVSSVPVPVPNDVYFHGTDGVPRAMTCPSMERAAQL